MTKDEKRALSVQRELAALADLSKSFDTVVADAVRLATDLRDAAGRCRRTLLDAQVDEQIDRLDYMMRRGAYANLRICVHCGASLSPRGKCDDDCIHSRVVDLSVDSSADKVVPINDAFYRDRG